ncbi:restriction modification system DNA specificity domain-containing protein [Methanolobus psychrophilus R15]|nr:restriction modification system DNA specificity domain-containing protein [Methanolobus psychrophilus R15]
MSNLSDWQHRCLGDVSEFVTSGSRDWAKFYSESGSKFIRMTNLTRGGIFLDQSDLKYVNVKSDSADGKRTSLKPGDILISITAELGKIGWVPDDIGEAYINQHTALVRIKGSVNSKFVAYLLSSEKLNNTINRLNDSGAKAGLNLPTVRKIPIRLPPLPEQKAIADLLSTWDEAIGKTERLIQAKEKRFKWLLRESIGKSLMDEHKYEWKKVKIGTFLKESRIPDNENNPKKRLSVKLHLKGVEIRDHRGTEVENSTVYFKRKAGQFIYGKQNIFKGAVGIVPNELNGYSSTQDIPAFEISENVDGAWLLCLFSYSNFYKKLENYASGSGSKRLHPNELFKTKITLPPLEEQKQIAETLSAAQQEIDLLKQLAKKYKIQKRGLMQKMLTGEWRVKEEIIRQYAEA